MNKDKQLQSKGLHFSSITPFDDPPLFMAEAFLRFASSHSQNKLIGASASLFLQCLINPNCQLVDNYDIVV
jgi:hypothetical protein